MSRYTVLIREEVMNTVKVEADSREEATSLALDFLLAGECKDFAVEDRYIFDVIQEK